MADWSTQGLDKASLYSRTVQDLLRQAGFNVDQLSQLVGQGVSPYGKNAQDVASNFDLDGLLQQLNGYTVAGKRGDGYQYLNELRDPTGKTVGKYTEIQDNSMHGDDYAQALAVLAGGGLSALGGASALGSSLYGLEGAGAAAAGGATAGAVGGGVNAALTDQSILKGALKGGVLGGAGGYGGSLLSDYANGGGMTTLGGGFGEATPGLQQYNFDNLTFPEASPFVDASPIAGMPGGSLGNLGLGQLPPDVNGFQLDPDISAAMTDKGGLSLSYGNNNPLTFDNLGAVPQPVGAQSPTNPTSNPAAPSLLDKAAVPAAAGAKSLLDTVVDKVPQIAGAVLGGVAAAKDQNQSTTRDPWGPAQDWIKQNIAQGQALQQQYQANPFSPGQQAAYNNYTGLLNSVNGNIGGLLGAMGANASGANQFSRSDPRKSLLGGSINLAGFNPQAVNLFPNRGT